VRCGSAGRVGDAGMGVICYSLLTQSVSLMHQTLGLFTDPVALCYVTAAVTAGFYMSPCLQCFDAVGWAAGRASGL